jgi:hypothetical protein
MHIFIATSYSFIYEPVFDKKVGIYHIPAINNYRVSLSGESQDMVRIQVFVLVVAGKEHDCIRSF